MREKKSVEQQQKALEDQKRREEEQVGAHFTCFTGTNVPRGGADVLSLLALLAYAKVQILTHREEEQRAETDRRARAAQEKEEAQRRKLAEDAAIKASKAEEQVF